MFFKKFFKKKNVADPLQLVDEWKQAGSLIPPPHAVKKLAVSELGKIYNCNILVETGTYLGEMVEYQINNFSTIYSIELSIRLFKRAEKKFKKITDVRLVQGDSGEQLKKIVSQLDSKALFWLDGHYSGGITAKGNKECPVPEELDAIFSSPYDHIILIDDARLFTGENDYPTVDEIRNKIVKYNKAYSIHIKDDIIRILPINN